MSQRRLTGLDWCVRLLRLIVSSDWCVRLLRLKLTPVISIFSFCTRSLGSLSEGLASIVITLWQPGACV